MNTCALVVGLVLGCAGPAPDPGTTPAAAAPAIPTAGAPAAPAFGAAAAAVPAFQAADRVDRWLAEDKARHFTMSFAVTAMTYGAARSVLEPEAALATAIGAAAVAGVAKEVVDVRAGRWFSLKDLAWDAAGVALGYVLVDRIR